MTDPSKHMPDPPADADLLVLVREGGDAAERQAAATELLLRYRDAVYLWCFRYTRDRERALDLSQDVMVSAWEKIGSFEGRSKFSSWLFSIARHRCIDASRRIDVLADEAISDEHPDPAPPPDESTAAGGSDQWILDLIRSELEPDEQTAIWLRCVERMPVEEITTMLGVSGASGARALLQRARRKLRAAMDRRGLAGRS
jgi:RNA polymerase sigma-70 factor (ECF subfamily)